MDSRQHRGLQIAATGRLVGTGPTWYVPSQTDDREVYRVDADRDWCSCLDHSETGFRCKHMWAVEYTVKLGIDTEGNEILTRTARVSYSQEWTSYNAAQVAEKPTFMRLLADLCSSVPQPPQTTGRPRLPLSDMAFAATFKVYSRFSSRRFSSDLRDAEDRGLIARAPHFNSVTGYMASPTLTPVLYQLITASSLPLKAVESDFAVDSSGFSTSRFDRWFDSKYGKAASKRRWIKAHVMCGVKTNIVTAIEITDSRGSDGGSFGQLVKATGGHFTMSDVSADKAYTSHDNLALVESLGAVPYMPFKSDTRYVEPTEDSAWARMYHRLLADRVAFATHYHKRSNVETTFAMIKGKFGDLAKVLAHNVVVVGAAALEFGIDPTFCAESLAAQELPA